MRIFQFIHISLISMAVLLGTSGCDKSAALQTALPLEELPAAFEKAFSKAKPELKGLATGIVTSVKSKDYPKAFVQLQSLAQVTDLTKEQSITLGRATLTINELLQAAEAKGDEKAAATRENYRLTK